MQVKCGKAATAQRLRAAGCPIEPAEENSDGLIIQQLGSPMENRIFSMKCGGTGYLFHASITCAESGPVTILSFGCELPWESNIAWLEDPGKHLKISQVYRLPNGDEFPRNLCLNHQTESSGTLRRGQSKEGFLLGWGTAPTPSKYDHGTIVEGNLFIIDQFGETHSGKLELLIDRSEKSAGVKERAGRELFAPEPGKPQDALIGEDHISMRTTGKLPARDGRSNGCIAEGP